MIWTYLMPLKCTLKMIKMENLCFVYFNTIKKYNMKEIKVLWEQMRY